MSDIPECTEVVEDKAAVFQKSNEKDLMKKLQILCKNAPLVLNYKEKAADFICNKYSWDDVVDITLKLYMK